MPKEFKRLTQEEEIAAWERGDYDALVESVWPYVMMVARKIRREDSAAYDEMISAAGLMITKALKTFDPHKARFITYACAFLSHRMHKAKQAFEQPEVTLISSLVAAPKDRGTELVDIADEYEVALSKLQDACTQWQLDAMTRRAAGETHDEIGQSWNRSKQASQQAAASGLAKAKSVLSESI